VQLLDVGPGDPGCDRAEQQREQAEDHDEPREHEQTRPDPLVRAGIERTAKYCSAHRQGADRDQGEGPVMERGQCDHPDGGVDVVARARSRRRRR
jgi:hypothetical protein